MGNLERAATARRGSVRRERATQQGLASAATPTIVSFDAGPHVGGDQTGSVHPRGPNHAEGRDAPDGDNSSVPVLAFGALILTKLALPIEQLLSVVWIFGFGVAGAVVAFARRRQTAPADRR